MVRADDDSPEKTPLPPISESSAAKLPSEITDEEDNANENDSSPLWNQDGWELTWPIWHLLPLSERKKLAHDHGYKTIGAFEEYMSLHQAMDDSEIIRPYANEGIYGRVEEDLTGKKRLGPKTSPKHAKPAAVKKVEEEDDDGEEEEDSDSEDLQRGSSATEELSLDELMDVGGRILMLHDEILHQIFAWLPVDTYATMAMASPHWKHFTRTETVYKRLCERLYLNQSKRRQLHVSRFGGSYRTMLEERPRVRAAGGCYVLKYSQVKKIQRDMWTEVPIGAILESIYYRYLYFQEDGRVLYALTSVPPHVMFRRLLKMCLKKTEDVATVWGSYQVQKNALTIVAQQPWHTIQFDLTIETESEHGRFGSLTLDRHLSSPAGCFEDWSRDRVEYKVPLESFRFVKSSFL